MKIIILSLMMIINGYAAEKSNSYSLNTFIQKALDASFSIRQDDAQLSIEKRKITQSTLWKNPALEMEFDEGLGNSMKYSYMEFSQKLPAWGENTSKRRAAQFELEHKMHTRDRTVLQVQYQSASLFQKIYSLKKQLDTVDQQIKQIERLQEKSISRENAGDISGLERSRIDIMKQQIVMKKQSLKNNYLEMQFQAHALLNVNGKVLLLGDGLKPKKYSLNKLLESLELSPVYRQYKAKVQVAKEELSLSKATRYASPELYVYSARELNLNNNTHDTNGFGFRMSVPLWNRKDSQIEIQNVKVQKSNIKAEETLYKLQQNVRSYYNLYKNASRQVKNYKENLLDPSKKYHEISTISFELGEKSLLELLDAQTLYFQNQLEYQTLVSQYNFYWLQLCNVASINLLKDNK